MNEEIRAKVDARLKEIGMTRADLARATDRSPQTISRALNGTGEGAGTVPALWAAILEALDLRLTVEPGQAAGTGEKGKGGA